MSWDAPRFLLGAALVLFALLTFIVLEVEQRIRHAQSRRRGERFWHAQDHVGWVVLAAAALIAGVAIVIHSVI